MSMLWFLLSGLCFANAMVLDGTQNIDYHFERQVAFPCGYASMYLTRDGWRTDLDEMRSQAQGQGEKTSKSQSCVRSAQDVLDYCTNKYQNVNVTNVMPAPSDIVTKCTALNGSRSGSESSTEECSVRPYRCIVGNFSSDQIVVPDNCVYANTSQSTSSTAQCASYLDWNSTAHERCSERKLELYSFGMVESCGVGKYKAVEYVCCPPTSTSSPTSTSESVQAKLHDVLDKLERSESLGTKLTIVSIVEAAVIVLMAVCIVCIVLFFVYNYSIRCRSVSVPEDKTALHLVYRPLTAERCSEQLFNDTLVQMS